MSRTTAYKIVPTILWDAQIRATGRFIGTESDVKDGFIHLSTAQQLEETATRRFGGQTGLSLLAVDLTRVQGEVRWEPSRSRKDELFPHIYGFMDTSCVIWARDLSMVDGVLNVSNSFV